MLLKVLIWGTGQTTEMFWQYRKNNWGFDVIAYIDNDRRKWHTQYKDKIIFPPVMMEELDYEKIIICVSNYQNIYKQLTEDFQIQKAEY